VYRKVLHQEMQRVLVHIFVMCFVMYRHIFFSCWWFLTTYIDIFNLPHNFNYFDNLAICHISFNIIFWLWISGLLNKECSLLFRNANLDYYEVRFALTPTLVVYWYYPGPWRRIFFDVWFRITHLIIFFLIAMGR